MAENKTSSDAPVAAREQVEQINSPGGDASATLEQRAKEQEAQQRDALSSSLSGAGNDAVTKVQAQASDAPAAARQGAPTNVPTQSGFMDQASRRSGSDALEGHFVSIDLNHKGVKQAYERAGLGDHRGDWGIYLSPTVLNPDTGIPEFGIVQLRDDTNARLTVPYDALSPSAAGRR
jgi:hypothetical protein